jgi:hypothetical protein
MGRFDVLSGNAFSSKATPPITHGNGERRRNNIDRNIRIRANDRGSRVNTEYSIEKDDFPEIPKVNKSTVDNKEIGGNQWVNAIKKREEDEKKQTNGINQLNPKYWRGVNWIGPMFIRHVNRKTEYSRDGNTWANCWDDTFSKEQLYEIKYEEEQEAWYESVNILEQFCDEREKESDKYYKETGQLDDLAIARLERIMYENYAEQFEVIDESNHIDEYTNDSDDYLEDD